MKAIKNLFLFLIGITLLSACISTEKQCRKAFAEFAEQHSANPIDFGVEALLLRKKCECDTLYNYLDIWFSVALGWEKFDSFLNPEQFNLTKLQFSEKERLLGTLANEAYHLFEKKPPMPELIKLYQNDQIDFATYTGEGTKFTMITVGRYETELYKYVQLKNEKLSLLYRIESFSDVELFKDCMQAELYNLTSDFNAQLSKINFDLSQNYTANNTLACEFQSTLRNKNESGLIAKDCLNELHHTLKNTNSNIERLYLKNQKRLKLYPARQTELFNEISYKIHSILETTKAIIQQQEKDDLFDIIN